MMLRPGGRERKGEGGGRYRKDGKGVNEQQRGGGDNGDRKRRHKREHNRRVEGIK